MSINLVYGPKVQPLPSPSPRQGRERSRKGRDSQPDRSSAEGALSQSCTQRAERILFLGFWGLEQWEEEQEWLDIGVFTATALLHSPTTRCSCLGLPPCSHYSPGFSVVGLLCESLFELYRRWLSPICSRFDQSSSLGTDLASINTWVEIYRSI